MDYEVALKIAHEWIDAWNQRDLDAIMEHYADDITFRSPLIQERMGIARGTITVKTSLRDYFAKGLNSNPTLHFELLQVLIGVDSITLYYQRDNGRQTAEMMMFDETGKVTNVRVHYTPIVRR
jgi:ketosteroid isomerase-like protein